jgi:hypothetical protein
LDVTSAIHDAADLLHLGQFASFAAVSSRCVAEGTEHSFPTASNTAQNGELHLFWLPQADQLSEEQKTFREAYQKNAGQPSRLRTEHAKETAFGGRSGLHAHPD